MEQKVTDYFELKRQQKEMEHRLAVLRDEIVAYCEGQGVYETRIGGFSIKTVLQHRKEYDDNKLYASFADPELWRLASRADGNKIKSLIKLGVLTEEKLRPAVTEKQVIVLQVDKL